MLLKLDYKSSLSLHEQIAEGIKNLIVNGGYLPHDKLPSVREMSVELTVNPNTVQRAYKLLEADEYIYSIKGKGNFISPVDKIEHKSMIKDIHKDLKKTIQELKYLGDSKEDIEKLLKEIYEETEEL